MTSQLLNPGKMLYCGHFSSTYTQLDIVIQYAYTGADDLVNRDVMGLRHICNTLSIMDEERARPVVQRRERQRSLKYANRPSRYEGGSVLEVGPGIICKSCSSS